MRMMVKKRIMNTDIWAVVSVIVFSFVAHSFRYFNLMFSHDSLLVYQDEIKWKIGLGRFFQPIYWLFRGELCAPLLLGICSIVWLSLAVVLILRLLDIKDRTPIVIVGGILSTCSTITYTNATYIHETDTYMLALLFAVASVYVWKKWNNGWLVGSVLIMISLGLYQSHFQSAVILALIVLVKMLLDEENFSKVFLEGIKAIMMLLIGGILYYGLFKLTLTLTGVSANTGYNGISSVGNYDGSSLPLLIRNTYGYAIRQFVFPETYNRKGIVTLVNSLLAILTVCGIIKIVRSKTLSKKSVILLVFLLTIMPFGMNVVYFISKGMEHSLMTFSFNFLYVFAVLIFGYCRNVFGDNKDNKKTKWSRYTEIAVVIGFFVLIWCNVVFSNQVYLKKGLQEQATLSIMTRVTERIEQTDGYVAGETPVAIVGNLNNSILAQERTGFEGVTGVGLYGNYAVTYELTYKEYYEFILSEKINLVSEKEVSSYSAMTEVRDMPAFPSAGCCKYIGKTLVIKLS